MKRKFDVSDVLKEAWGLTVDYFLYGQQGLLSFNCHFLFWHY